MVPLAVIACDEGTGGGGSGRDEVITEDVATSASALSPLPDLPPDTTNKYADNAAAAALGQKLFFDKAFSAATTAAGAANSPLVGASGSKCNVNCASCHDRQPGLDDSKTPNHVAIGTGVHPHNAPNLVNSAFYDWVNWDGRFRRAWELPLPVAENPAIMNNNRLRLARVMYDKYKDEYNAVFTENPLDERLNQAGAGVGPSGEKFLPGDVPGGKPSGNLGCNVVPMGDLEPTPADAAKPCNAWDKGLITTTSAGKDLAARKADKAVINRVGANFGKAIQAYIRKLVSRNTPFDKYVAAGFKGNDINESAKKGLALFVGKAACNKCHGTPLFSDSGFRVTGVPHINASQMPPPGNVTTATDDGRFKAATVLVGAGQVNVASVYSDDAALGAMLLADIPPPVGAVPTPAPAEWKGTFRDPTLRGVAETGPFMHSGEIKTLEEVIDFYNKGGGSDPATFAGTKDPLLVELNLTDDEKAQLVEFIKTLSGGDAIDASLNANTAVATPAGAAYCQ